MPEKIRINTIKTAVEHHHQHGFAQFMALATNAFFVVRLL